MSTAALSLHRLREVFGLHCEQSQAALPSRLASLARSSRGRPRRHLEAVPFDSFAASSGSSSEKLASSGLVEGVRLVAVSR
mmetsp:Transcript_3355/g.7513  ORF Transcript_3355/g.7513 Transcript_3355/m.7513 type:complete len:81 (-) Transcript_3355:51-293(-)